MGRSSLMMAAEDRSLVLALAGEPKQSAVAIAVEIRSSARAGWMQSVMLLLVYAAVARARLGQADQALALVEAAERTRRQLGYEHLPIMAHVGADHLHTAVESLASSVTAHAYRRGNVLDVGEAVDLACLDLP